MDDKDERQRRARVIRQWLGGKRSHELLRRAQRSRAWLSKWRRRFERDGRAGLKSRSRRPRRSPRACSKRVVGLIVQTRRRLVRQPVGLIGPRAIRRELRQLRLGRQLPSLATIKRVLRAQGLVKRLGDPPAAYFPHPQTVLSSCLHAIDWTCRYLETGPKVYAFHTLNLRTRACAQTIATDKSTPTGMRHVLDAWETLGIPVSRSVQLDNDAAFNGGYKVPRVIGQLVRLCLSVGIELIFLPVAEPERNGVIEQLNQLWSQAFFNKRRFSSVRHVTRTSPDFVRWYMTQYAPPALGEHTPRAMQRTEPQRRLTPAQRTQLPEALPVTAGRIHFIRQVAPDGPLTLLNETWPVSRRLAGKYVWATVTTHRRQLELWYQRSAQSPWQLRKTVVYDIPETVAHLKPEFAREA
jgi:putative transposase